MSLWRGNAKGKQWVQTEDPYAACLVYVKHKHQEEISFIIIVLGAMLDKKQTTNLHQLIFKPLFLIVNQDNFCETFTWGNYML